MPMTCGVCRLPDDRLAAVNRELRRGLSVRDIAGRYGISKSAVSRHKRDGHVARAAAVQPGETGRVGGPPRGYTWAPFEAGNLASVRHGASSARIVAPVARRLADDLMAEAAEPGSRVAYLLAEPVSPGRLAAWAENEARIALYATYLQKHGEWDEKGNIRPQAHKLTQLQVTAIKLSASLGLDPLSRARLGKDIAGQALDLARIWAQEARNGAEANGGSHRALDAQEDAL